MFLTLYVHLIFMKIKCQGQNKTNILLFIDYFFYHEYFDYE